MTTQMDADIMALRQAISAQGDPRWMPMPYDECHEKSSSPNPDADNKKKNTRSKERKDSKKGRNKYNKADVVADDASLQISVASPVGVVVSNLLTVNNVATECDADAGGEDMYQQHKEVVDILVTNGVPVLDFYAPCIPTSTLTCTPGQTSSRSPSLGTPEDSNSGTGSPVDTTPGPTTPPISPSNRRPKISWPEDIEAIEEVDYEKLVVIIDGAKAVKKSMEYLHAYSVSPYDPLIHRKPIQKEAKCDEDKSSTLVLKNLPFHLRHDRLMKELDNLNIKPTYVRYYHDNRGFFKGICFAKYKTQEWADKAMEVLQVVEIGHRRLRVEYRKKLARQDKKGPDEDEFPRSADASPTPPSPPPQQTQHHQQMSTHPPQTPPFQPTQPITIQSPHAGGPNMCPGLLPEPNLGNGIHISPQNLIQPPSPSFSPALRPNGIHIESLTPGLLPTPQLDFNLFMGPNQPMVGSPSPSAMQTVSVGTPPTLSLFSGVPNLGAMPNMANGANMCNNANLHNNVIVGNNNLSLNGMNLSLGSNGYADGLHIQVPDFLPSPSSQVSFPGALSPSYMGMDPTGCSPPLGPITVGVTPAMPLNNPSPCPSPSLRGVQTPQSANSFVSNSPFNSFASNNNSFAKNTSMSQANTPTMGARRCFKDANKGLGMLQIFRCKDPVQGEKGFGAGRGKPL